MCIRDRNYYKSYTCDTIIKKFEKYIGVYAPFKDQQFHTWTVKLINSYPYMISSIPYSSGGSGVVKLSIGMYYEYSEFVSHNIKTIPLES